MEIIKDIQELKNLFIPGFHIFTNDSYKKGINQHLAKIGLKVEVEKLYKQSFQLNRRINRTNSDIILHYPVTEASTYYVEFIEYRAPEERLLTAIELKVGRAPIIYDIVKTILDNGYKVGVPNLESFIKEVSIFAKKEGVYFLEGRVVV